MAVLEFEFLSKVLGEMTNVAVALPMTPAGRKLVKEGGRFPVIYLLHGGGGDCRSFLKDTSIERFSRQGNFAVVMPEVRCSYYCDMVYGLPFFRYISEELPEVMEKNFPIRADREGRFVMGNSMGAQGSIKWALRRPMFFKAAAGLSGVGTLEDLGFMERFEDDDPRYAPFRASYGSPEEYLHGNDNIKELAKKLVESGSEIPELFSCCGTEDFVYQGCKKFAAYAESIGLPFTFLEGAGAHTYDYWEKWMRHIIKWFGFGEVA